MSSSIVLGVCLALAASFSPQAKLPTQAKRLPSGAVFVPESSFTLAWTHSIEKTAWQEDYRVERDAQGLPVLHLLSARIRGSGAGMEPPQDSVLQDGWYHYWPRTQTQQPLRLTRSEHTPDYQWCQKNQCHPLSQWLPSDGDVTLLWPCSGQAR